MFTFISIVAVLTTMTLLSGVLFPYTRCRRCQGRKKFDQPGTIRAWRPCGACGGSGQRERLSGKIARRIVSKTR